MKKKNDDVLKVKFLDEYEDIETDESWPPVFRTTGYDVEYSDIDKIKKAAKEGKEWVV